jgi:hypothetical protein
MLRDVWTVLTTIPVKVVNLVTLGINASTVILAVIWNVRMEESLMDASVNAKVCSFSRDSSG